MRKRRCFLWTSHSGALCQIGAWEVTLGQPPAQCHRAWQKCVGFLLLSLGTLSTEGMWDRPQFYVCFRGSGSGGKCSLARYWLPGINSFSCLLQVSRARELEMLYAVSVRVDDVQSFQLSRYFLSRPLCYNNNSNKYTKNQMQNLAKPLPKSKALFLLPPFPLTPDFFFHYSC